MTREQLRKGEALLAEIAQKEALNDMLGDGASLALLWNGRYIDDLQKCISQLLHTSVLLTIQDHVKESIVALKKEFEEL